MEIWSDWNSGENNEYSDEQLLRIFERILEKNNLLFIGAGRTFLVSHLEHEKFHHLEHGGNQFIT